MCPYVRAIAQKKKQVMEMGKLNLCFDNPLGMSSLYFIIVIKGRLCCILSRTYLNLSAVRCVASPAE